MSLRTANAAHPRLRHVLLVLGNQLDVIGGLQAGLSRPWMGRALAAGLALTMLVGIGVRIMIMATHLQTTPAPCYLVQNAYLYMAAF